MEQLETDRKADKDKRKESHSEANKQTEKCPVEQIHLSNNKDATTNRQRMYRTKGDINCTVTDVWAARPWTQLHPLRHFEPDLFFGAGDQPMHRLDLLTRYQHDLELLNGSDQHDRGLQVGEAVGGTLTPAREAERWEDDAGSAFAPLLREAVRVKPVECNRGHA